MGYHVTSRYLILRFYATREIRKNLMHMKNWCFTAFTSAQNQAVNFFSFKLVLNQSAQAQNTVTCDQHLSVQHISQLISIICTLFINDQHIW